MLQTKDRGLREVMMGVHNPSDEVHARLLDAVSTLVRRAQDAGAVRRDAVASDLGCVLLMLCHVADLGAGVTPDLWRRYLPTLLAGLRPDGPALDGTPLTDVELQSAAMAMTKCVPPLAKT